MRQRHSTEKYNTLWESTIAAAGGLVYAIRKEKKIRQVFISLVIATTICMIADIGYFQILMVIFSWVISLICEILNTSLEKAMDYACGKEYHPLIRQGKDYAGACTFVALTFAVLLTSFVLWDRYFGDARLRAKTFQAVSSAQES